MGTAVGAVWATRGWFGAAIDDANRWDCDLFPCLWSLWHTYRDADVILVDMAVGLPDVDHGRRECDRLAKQLLGSRHPGVYYAPIRDAIYQPSLSAAKQLNEVAGFSIQNQTWSIVPRIREVDEFLDAQPGARDRIRETRAEVCYHTFAGSQLEHPPTTSEGTAERRTILASISPGATAALDAAIATFTTPPYAPTVTDAKAIRDAFVTALTARRDSTERATLPLAPPTDERGLPMSITHPATQQQTTACRPRLALRAVQAVGDPDKEHD